MYPRDMMHMSAVLDYFGSAGKPLHITEVEVPSQDDSDLRRGEEGQEGWNESRQGQWIEQFYKIALSKGFVDTVTYSNLTDRESKAMANSGLLTEQFEAKKSFRALKKLHNTIFTH
jgi:hypothetical protein